MLKQSNVALNSHPGNISTKSKYRGKKFVTAALLAVVSFFNKSQFLLKKKPLTFEKVHQNFAEIFKKKDLSKEQAEMMLQRYQEIYNIKDKDKDDFIKQAFEQIKKDFGYENTSIKLQKWDI